MSGLKSLGAVALLLALVGPLPGRAAESGPVLSIENHRFSPERLSVPAGKKIRLRIKNLDPTPEEFESYALNREKIVPGGSEVTIYIGPLKAGEYPFFGEFNQATAQGVIVAE